jgi:hypothetical protein
VGNRPLGYVDPYGEDFHVVGASGLLTPGPLGYLSGDTGLEQLAAGGYNAIPEAGNIVANVITAIGEAIEGAIDFSKWLSRELGGSTSNQEFVGRAVGVGSILIGGPQARLGSCTAKGVMPQILKNKVAGDAFRDEIATLLRNEGRDVATEVYKKTPFGRRFIEVSQAGQVLGGIETKFGDSRYSPLQRAKDSWLWYRDGDKVDVVRDH